MKSNEKLVSLRKEKRLSQIEVAEILGVSRQAISRWEVGAALPSTENLKRLAELYGVSVDALLNENAKEHQQPERTEIDKALPVREKCASEDPIEKKAGWKRSHIAVIFVLVLMGFILGYVIGHQRAEQDKNEPIPLSELETEYWDFSDAEEYTYGWPEYEEGGE